VDGGWFGAQRLYLGRQWDDAAVVAWWDLRHPCIILK
jgi:hypothetical protein